MYWSMQDEAWSILLRAVVADGCQYFDLAVLDLWIVLCIPGSGSDKTLLLLLLPSTHHHRLPYAFCLEVINAS